MSSSEIGSVTRSGKGPFVEPGPQLQSIRRIMMIMVMTMTMMMMMMMMMMMIWYIIMIMIMNIVQFTIMRMSIYFQWRKVAPA